jgi:hypothetical protein
VFFTDLVNVLICPESVSIIYLLSSRDWMHGQARKGQRDSELLRLICVPDFSVLVLAQMHNASVDAPPKTFPPAIGDERQAMLT